MMLNMQFDQRVTINTNDRPWAAEPGVRSLAQAAGARRSRTRSRHQSCSLCCGGFVSASRTSAWGGNSGTGRHVFRRAWRFRSRYVLPQSARIEPCAFQPGGLRASGQLHQFLPNDSAQVCIDTSQTRWLPGSGTLSVMPLHEFAGERVALMKWAAGERAQSFVTLVAWRFLCCQVNSRMSKAPIPEAPGSAIRR